MYYYFSCVLPYVRAFVHYQRSSVYSFCVSLRIALVISLSFDEKKWDKAFPCPLNLLTVLSFACQSVLICMWAVLSSSKMIFYNVHCLLWNSPTTRQTDPTQERKGAEPEWRSRRPAQPIKRSLRKENYQCNVDQRSNRQSINGRTILFIPCGVLFQRVPL